MRRQVADGIDGLLWAGTEAPRDDCERDDGEENCAEEDGDSELN
jgi:hypothetical protein